MSKSSN